MSIKDEQEAAKQNAHYEAARYLRNAEDTLKKAGQDGKSFLDRKYVSTACGTAYLGVLIAMDAMFQLRDVKPPKGNKRESIKYYLENAAKLDGKLVRDLNIVYRNLHIEGYYEGNLSVPTIRDGFDRTYEIIERICPERELTDEEYKARRRRVSWVGRLAAWLF
ncbi:hypothetical protein FACS1894139_10810 [Planctomycetales bacterium]|nr:hypothetical protein FACS1894108_08450 [Planctomycetales bacterium]GHT05980.1 hypothetical protein FACS1894139_10810 [Planctomycetales bacterium]